MSIQEYHQLFMDYLQDTITLKEPKNLYEPELYILQLGGKRLRPILSLLATEAFGGKAADALPAALAVEVFHNFTLLHDDIMDEAPVRRGKPTVHKKWNTNTGILSGDVMLINAYQFLEVYKPDTFKKLSQLFSKTAVEVCEGQQYDMDFETRDDVTLDAYLKMITYKTSVLVAAALQMGAIVAGVSSEEQATIYEFGIQLGLAFQLQDDYLDTFGNQATFGKRIGGDILERKKTWLYIKTLELLQGVKQQEFKELYNIDNKEEQLKIKQVKQVFKDLSIDKLISEEIKIYSTKALEVLDTLNITKTSYNALQTLVKQLEERQQ